ncbi:hypothetical protein Tco_0513493 [Tanacetum coccineum]
MFNESYDEIREGSVDLNTEPKSIPAVAKDTISHPTSTSDQVDVTFDDDNYDSEDEEFGKFDLLFGSDEGDLERVVNDESVRRSSRKTSLPNRLKDYEIQGKVKYGLKIYVNYAKLSYDNYSFVTNLKKTIEPKTYKEASMDCKWVEAMNNEMEALNRNGTWEITKLPKARKVGAPGMGVMYKASDGFELTAFVDSDWAKCNVTRRYVIKYAVFLASCLVSWKSQK